MSEKEMEGREGWSACEGKRERERMEEINRAREERRQAK